MDKTYIEIVRLLLESAPAIFETPHFAMKGGTSINLFIEDMPRLSVDIDVVYTDHQATRDEALKSISKALEAVRKRLAKAGLEADMSSAFENEFVGMARNPITLAELQQVRRKLKKDLPAALTASQRKFLLGLVVDEPDWQLMRCLHLSHLPAIRWKLQNLAKLKKSNPTKFAQQAAELRARLAG